MIYFVTDRTLCSKEHYLKVIEQSCEAGVEAIILREKDLSSEELLALAVEVKTIVEGTNTKLIINSNIEVAKAIKSHGMHLSYKDFMDYKGFMRHKGIQHTNRCYDSKACIARQTLQETSKRTFNKMNIKNDIYYGIIGVSVHSVEEGISAYENGADYIMYGHVFASSCKKGVPPRGIEALTELKDRINIPIVAIGGINSSNFREAINAGADKIAMRSPIIECNDVIKYLSKFRLNNN